MSWECAQCCSVFEFAEPGHHSCECGTVVGAFREGEDSFFRGWLMDGLDGRLPYADDWYLEPPTADDLFSTQGVTADQAAAAD